MRDIIAGGGARLELMENNCLPPFLTAVKLLVTLFLFLLIFYDLAPGSLSPHQVLPSLLETSLFPQTVYPRLLEDWVHPNMDRVCQPFRRSSPHL